MNWYPFDTEVCSMKINVPEDMNDFITLEDNGLKNLGPVELTQYFIQNTEMSIGHIGNQQAVIVQVTLGRRLLGALLTVFLPTILLNVIGHTANYFETFYFESIISVNLTVMLVLTTMFINVSNQLPKTSYIKMMDVWLIFNLIVPFVEVLLHTYKEGLRQKSENKVKNQENDKNVDQWKDSKIDTVIKTLLVNQKIKTFAFVKVKRKESKTTNNLHANNWNNSQGMEKRRTECARVRSLS